MFKNTESTLSNGCISVIQLISLAKCQQRKLKLKKIVCYENFDECIELDKRGINRHEAIENSTSRYAVSSSTSIRLD